MLEGGDVNDQAWAIVIGAGVMVAIRILDFFLPKGRMSKWAKEHSVKDEEYDEE
jgi:hypothetical protein